ncbi:MAG: ankyrin repeat domain-containing protein [Candidatus Micrarchaeota archaeon]|nr:ankyrin repeat domain-containing protein [Candidatus Micrarchaeota archaeon]
MDSRTLLQQKLSKAVAKKDFVKVKLLVEASSDPNNLLNSISSGWHVLSLAAFYSSLPIVKYLLQQGSDVRQAFLTEKDPLFFSITRSGMFKDDKESVRIFSLILKEYERYNLPISNFLNEYLMTYLAHACNVGSINSVSKLLKHYSTDPETTVFTLTHFNNPLLRAIENNRPDILQILFSFYRVKEGKTVLVHEALRKLLERSIDGFECHIVMHNEMKYLKSASN